jgi:uncharacterized protein (DUF1810 family)
MAKDLVRFLDAQNHAYLRALEEIRKGKKTSHWMWYIFPQIAGLGHSDTAKYYAINDLDEATEYLNHPVLGNHLIEIATDLLAVNNKTAQEIFGTPDNLKLRSSMTLFAEVEGADLVFQKVLDKYFDDQPDTRTLSLLKPNNFKSK